MAKRLFIIVLCLNCALNHLSAQVALGGLNFYLGGSPGAGTVYGVLNPTGFGKYIVYGEFDEVYDSYGTAVTAYGVAVVSKDMTVQATDQITASTPINGAVKKAVWGFNNLYIFGDFTQVGAETVTGAARLNSLGTVSTTWQPEFDNGGTSAEIRDVVYHQNRVVVCGEFLDVRPNSAGAWEPRFNMVSLHPGNASINTFAEFATYYPYRGFVFDNEMYVVAADGGATSAITRALYKLDANGVIDPAYTMEIPNGFEDHIYDVTRFRDSLIVSVRGWKFTWPNTSNQLLLNRLDNGDSLLCSTNSLSSTTSGKPIAVEAYGDYVYTLTDDSLYRSLKLDNMGCPPSNQSSSLNLGINTPSNINERLADQMFLFDNKLFLTAPEITSAQGKIQHGLTVYCLPPFAPEQFTINTSSVCAGQTIAYQVAPSPNADGYVWTYTGDGAYMELTDTNYFAGDLTADAISIEFTQNFTPGDLIVRAFAECGTDTLYSDSLVLSITALPLPTVDAGTDTTLTCVRDSVTLQGTSPNLIVSWEWFNDIDVTVSMADTLYVHRDSANAEGSYALEVTDNLGCKNRDTIIVYLDTLKPNLSIPAGPHEINCYNPVLNIPISSSNVHTSFAWSEGIAGPLNNNATITASNQNAYYIYVTDTLNGCVKDSSIFIQENTVKPDIAVQGYPGYSSLNYIDTLTCYQSNILLDVVDTAANVDIYWSDANYSANNGVSNNVNTGGTYYIYAFDNANGCEDTMQVHMFVNQNYPDLLFIGDSSINCSVDSALFIINSTYPDTAVLFEIGGAIGDSAYVNTAGYQSYSVQLLENGCTTIDSTLVSITPEIYLTSITDTLVCVDVDLTLETMVQGNVSGLTYNWSNGSTADTAVYNSGAFSQAIVEVNGNGGCYGTDTIQINIPNTPTDSIVTVQPCGTGASGSITCFLSGGIAPYSYSLDGLSYQSNPSFGGLTFGNYTVFVKDSLGCDYSFTASINQNSNLPSPEFLMSTYNHLNDTITAVDVSIAVADSVQWNLPSELFVIDSNTVAPSFIATDTGVFTVEMIAYYGACDVATSKLCYVDPYDSTIATNFNQNGIRSVQLYPNPNTGAFTYEIEMYAKQNVVVKIFDVDANQVYTYESPTQTDFIEENVNLSNPQTGTYVLKIIGEFDSAHSTFIVGP